MDKKLLGPASPGLSRTGQRCAAAGFALLALLLWRPLGRLLWQLLFALLMTALALPLAKALEKRMNGTLAALAAVGLLVAALLGMVGLLVPPLLEQVRLIIAQAPQLLRQLQAVWEQVRQEEWIAALGEAGGLPESWLARAAAWAGEKLPALLSLATSGFDALSRAFLSPLLAFYFLRDREMFSYQLSLWIPLRRRRKMLAALQAMRRETGGYLRGQLLVALAVGVLTALGLLMGLCELIPYVGPLIGGVPIALFSLPLGFTATLWALGVTIAVQQIEGLFLSPFLMAGATGLHPVYVVLLLSAGGLLLGLPGMVIALPAFLCVRGGLRALRTAEDP